MAGMSLATRARPRAGRFLFSGTLPKIFTLSYAKALKQKNPKKIEKSA
jgi:hypothetical protein